MNNVMNHKSSSSLLNSSKQANPQRQKKLLLIQAQTKYLQLSVQLKQTNQQLNDSKDMLRKYRQKTIPSLITNPDCTWQNQSNYQSILTLNNGGFYHQIPLNKLNPYLQTRIEKLMQIKKNKQKQIKVIIQQYVKWLKDKFIVGNQVSLDVREKVRQYMEDLDDD